MEAPPTAVIESSTFSLGMFSSLKWAEDEHEQQTGSLSEQVTIQAFELGATAWEDGRSLQRTTSLEAEVKFPGRASVEIAPFFFQGRNLTL